MTKKLEELLDLPDSKEIIKQDKKREKKEVIEQQNETLRDIAEFDKIAAAQTNDSPISDFISIFSLELVLFN